MYPETRTVVLPPDHATPAAARAFTVEQLHDWQLDGLTDVGALLVSELVTNAVRHAGSDVALSLCRSPGGVRVGVHDEAPAAVPVLADPPSLSYEGGRGLVLVDGLARRWGCDVGPDGKEVWFEL